MTGKPKDPYTVEFRKDGVYLLFASGLRERIADPITITALGKGLQDKIAYTIIVFRDRDGTKRETVLPSSLLTASTNALMKRLTDEHYRWPESKGHRERVIAALSVKNPAARIDVTMVPGWHGPRYVLPGMIAAPEGDDWSCAFYYSDNVHLAAFLRTGRLGDWQMEVAKHCRISSRLRLALGAAFAAPLLRLVKLDTFGFYFVGETSKGKSLCLRVGGSVAGLNSEAGLDSWDGSQSGFDERALGHRDCAMVADEASVLEGDLKMRRAFVRLTTFRLAKNQRKVRAGQYDRAIGAVKSDHRVIILASGEDILFEPGRMRGEDVRMIHIPCDASVRGDIFDGSKADAIAGVTADDRDKYVGGIEKATFEYQGTAFRAFIRRLVGDQEAERAIRGYMKEFAAKTTLPVAASAFTRIRRGFAVVYAGLALAIDYEILGFSKAASLRDIQTCMHDAITLLMERVNAPHTTLAAQVSDDDLVNGFRTRLASAKFLKVGRSIDPRGRLSVADVEAADGFLKFSDLKKLKALLPAERLREWYPDAASRNRLVAVLRGREIFHAGRQSDASTRLETIPPCTRRPPCYWVSLRALGLRAKDLVLS